MELGEMKRNTSNWSNFCMLPRQLGLLIVADVRHCIDAEIFSRF